MSFFQGPRCPRNSERRLKKKPRALGATGKGVVLKRWSKVSTDSWMDNRWILKKSKLVLKCLKQIQSIPRISENDPLVGIKCPSDCLIPPAWAFVASWDDFPSDIWATWWVSPCYGLHVIPLAMPLWLLQLSSHWSNVFSSQANSIVNPQLLHHVSVEKPTIPNHSQVSQH